MLNNSSNCMYSISMVLQMMLRQQEISYAKRKYLEMPNKPISCCFLMVLVSVIHSKDNSFFLSISVHKSFKLLSLDKIVRKFMAYWPFGKQAQRFVWLDGIAVGSFCKEPPKILGGLFYSFQGLSFSSLQWAEFSFSRIR